MFQRHRDEEALHIKGSISQAMQVQRQAMQAEILHLSESDVNVTRLEQIAETVAAKFAIDIPVLDESAIKPASREIDIDVSSDPTRMAFHTGRQAIVKGTEISISVPFKGDAEVFRFHPSNHTMEYPPGRIDTAAIVFRSRGVDLDPTQVRHEFDRWLTAVKSHLAGMIHELGTFNDQLRAEALNLLTTRVGKFKRDGELLAGLGF